MLRRVNAVYYSLEMHCLFGTLFVPNSCFWDKFILSLAIFPLFGTLFVPNSGSLAGDNMGIKKSTKIKEVIENLFLNYDQINLNQIAKASSLSIANETHRKAIRRELKKMIDMKLIAAEGATRNRIYIILKKNLILKPATQATSSAFEDVELSPESRLLLNLVSKPLRARKPVGYNQDFLNAYIPNRTFYLDESTRHQLEELGRRNKTDMPAGTYARSILNRLLIELSWNSSRLEGNTYSLLETQRLIEQGKSATGKNAIESQMIINHKNAIEYIVVGSTSKKITGLEVCSVHALLAENLLGNPNAPGSLRQITVNISGTTYLPLDNPHTLRDCFKNLIIKLNLIKNPFEQSFFALIHLSYLQAFEDVNKRTARLVANIPLIKANLIPLSFTDVEQDAFVKALIGIYEKNDISIMKDLYAWAYQRSTQKYSAVQKNMNQPNLLKLKYASIIQKIIITVVEKKIDGANLVPQIKALIKTFKVIQKDSANLFHTIETELMSLHDGNIARYKIKPSQFKAWKKLT